jgi:protein-disulfide isomerase
MKPYVYAFLLIAGLSLSVFAADAPSEPAMAVSSKTAESAVNASSSVPTVIAKVGTTTITSADLERGLSLNLYQAQSNIYQMEKNWINEQAKNILFDRAAASAGLSRKDWEKREIDSKVTPPTQKDLDELFKRFPQPQPVSTDTVKQATAYLSNQKHQQRENELFSELTKGTTVEVFLAEPKPPHMDMHFSADDPVKGPADAPVTILEFTDFQCPYCKQAQNTLKQIEQAYEGKVRIIAEQFPLAMHPRARPAAEAALCAQEQGKFWEYRDKLFDKQQLSDEDFKRYARELGLKEKKFDKCMSSHAVNSRLEADISRGQSYGIHGTPFFIVNGVPFPGAMPFEQFKQTIDEELQKK